MNLIDKILQQVLKENMQLADKLYFKTGKLSEQDKQVVLDVTGGDYTTKAIADLLFCFNTNHYFFSNADKVNELHRIYDSLKSYHPNVFPIKGFNKNIDQNNINALLTLMIRRKTLELFTQLPSIAKRNLKQDIRTPRDYDDFNRFNSHVKYLIAQISLVSNKSEAVQKKIFNKAFKLGMTVEKLIDFFDEKQNLIEGEQITAEQIKSLVAEESDMTIVFDKKSMMVVRVESPYAIKKIGCNSLWCFTYGDGFNMAWRQWQNYSTNDIVYVIFDFREPYDSAEFMYVLIKPVDWKYDVEEHGDDGNELYDLTNTPADARWVLPRLFGKTLAKKIFTFEWD